MKVSIDWLKELVNLNITTDELIRLIPMRTIGTKEITDKFIELDMKGYNRADLLSMMGVAYEVAATVDSKVNFTEVDQFVWTGRNLQDVEIKVKSELCSVYCVAKIEGIKVGKSSKEWVKKLEDSGFRPVNNIADVTNLIMAEYGQPLHAFDANKIVSEKLIVRLASQGETLQTLDGKNRSLDNNDLLIADEQKPLGLAGVMGGKDSEVSNTTTAILLEAAIFDPVNIRRTANRHTLQSEASKRFQHGLTKKRLLQALDAAIKMYEQLGGDLTAISLTGDFKEEHKTVKLTHKKVNKLIGIEIKDDLVKDLLTRLNFKLASHLTSGNTEWEVEVPYWRLDINIEEDLVEEVARMYGYEKIFPQELRGKLPKPIDQRLFNLIYDLKTKLVDLGLTEVQTYSFYSTQTLKVLGDKNRLVRIANPISSETEYMRQNLWPNLVEVVGKNIKQGFEDIAIFEIGKVYWMQDGKPEEQYRLTIALMNNSDNPIQELNQISQSLGLSFKKQDLTNRELFHPVRFIDSLVEIHPRVLHQYGIEKKVAVLEVTINPEVST